MLWRILIALAISLPVAKGKQAKTLKSANFKKVQNFILLIRFQKVKSWAHQPISGPAGTGPTKKKFKKKYELSDDSSIFSVARFYEIETSPTGVSGCMDE